MTELPKEAFSPIDLFLRLQGKTVAYFPNTGNAGDGFIAHATFVLLDRFGVRVRPCRADERVEGEIVLFGGGGNLVEGRYSTMMTTISRNLQGNLCYLLPHTIDGYEKLTQATHSSLTVFARDPRSFDGMVRGGAHPDRCFLAHDMTFYLPATHLPKSPAGNGRLSCFRVDAEAQTSAIPVENVDLSLSWNGDWWWLKSFCCHTTHSLMELIKAYQVIATDRLHIGILAAFLGKRVLLAGNNYYKNAAVYAHSMKSRFSNVAFYENKADLLAILAATP